MSQPIFNGLVDVNIYFGTKFDDVNVPYHMGMVKAQATKVLSRPSQIVWQSTFLTEIDIEVEDYQEIVGAQYLEIIDVGTQNHGAHWFTIQSYTQVASKTVRLGILYDPLLTIGIHHITGISGVMQRWTVSDDSHFNYFYTPEPLNQADDFVYNYYRIHHTTGGERNLAGFPYDMTKVPDIVSYESEGTSANTNIYYPKLTAPQFQTQFKTAVGSEMSVRDGLTYYGWAPIAGNNVYDNYSRAIGLGHELVCNGYILPISDLISVDGSANGYQTITGTSKTYSTGMGLYDSGTNNAKAAELGTTFLLYNEISGDAVEIRNADLSNTSVQVWCNPYCTGRFYARLSGYFDNTSGQTGLVKSPGYRGLSIASATGYGVTSNLLNNAMQVNSAAASYDSQQRSAENALEAARINQAYTRGTEEYALRSPLYWNEKRQLRWQNPLVANQWTGAVGDFLPNLLMRGSGTPPTMFEAGNEAMKNYRLADNEFNTAMTNLTAQRAAQMAMLGAQGDITRSTPPAFKFAMSSDVVGNTYDFCVRRSGFSVRDRKRIDNFFTAYGYNVDNTPLNSPDQLHNRSRFTFIQADNVNIISVSGGTDLTRLRDWRTVEMIKERFAVGLRIWYDVIPDYDWSIPNPIGGAN